MGKKPKIALICSAGGHFFQMCQLKDWWSKHKHFWVTSNRLDKEKYLSREKVYFGYFPENRNIVNAIKNLFLAFKILDKERPDVIFSTGAGIAPPFFLVGKIMNLKLIYLETASYIGIPTLSGRLIHPIANVFLVQHKSSQKLFSKSRYRGGLV